jgi:hypothetical protein
MMIKRLAPWAIGTVLALLAIAGLFLLRHPMLVLSYDEFNRKGAGWRQFYDERGDCLKGAEEIEVYLSFHKELAAGDRTILNFHAAQMFAGSGMYAKAMPYLDRATNSFMRPEWNDMVMATRAFLLNDRAQLNAARERLLAAHAPDDPIQEVNMLVAHFGESYADMRWWAPISKAVALPKGAPAEYHAAAERLASALGLSVVEAVMKPDRCIWLELHPWDSSTDHWRGYNYWDGYIILHYDNGTVITASSQQWLDKGVERFIRSCRDRRGKREAPTGMTTSFAMSR